MVMRDQMKRGDLELFKGLMNNGYCEFVVGDSGACSRTMILNMIMDFCFFSIVFVIWIFFLMVSYI